MRVLLIILWLLYFLFPADLIPDYIPGLGRVDDLIVAVILYYYAKKKKPADASRSSSNRQYGDSESEARRAEQEAKSGGASRKEPRDPYEILGIDRSATPEEIKSAYRLRAVKYHPDKVSHLGEEFQTLAKEKFQDIQWAYDQLTGAAERSRTR